MVEAAERVAKQRSAWQELDASYEPPHLHGMADGMLSLNVRAALATIVLGIAMAALIFVPAGTLHFWQGWLFMAVWLLLSVAVTVYLAIHDPELLERRMKGGPTAETEKTQQIIMTLAMAAFVALLVFPALDHRFGWSPVPWFVALIGDGLVAIGFLAMFFVLRTNRYGASTIQVAEDQPVISTGPYALVRHPMYAGALVMVLGIPLALDSGWGLLVVLLFVPVLIWRLLDEERFLKRNLPGYSQYMRAVRYRLVPRVW